MLTIDLVQSVLDALPTPVFVKNRAGVYMGCNRAFSEIMGKTPDQLAGMTVFDLSPRDLAQIYFNADEALMSSGGEQRNETQIQLPNGERRDVLFYKAVLRDVEGNVSGLVGTLLDITDRKRLERQLADLANQDALTGLLNRRGVFGLLEAELAEAGKAHQPVSVLMCDIDYFKSINDRYGHAGGDEVLRATAQLLRSHLRDQDRIGRIGGEEFLIVLRDMDLGQASLVAERLRKIVGDARVNVEEGDVQVTISIGLSQTDTEDKDWRKLIKRADDGLYEAKRQGRNRVIGKAA